MNKKLFDNKSSRVDINYSLSSWKQRLESMPSSSLLHQVLSDIFIQNLDDGVEVSYYFSCYLVIISYYANCTRM